LALRTKQAAARSSAMGKDIVERSLAQGEQLGRAIAAWAAQDGADEAHAKAKTYKLPAGDQWNYVITTPGTNVVEPYWGTVRPFALETSSICDVPLNIELSSD